jgi:hypothetical protein
LLAGVGLAGLALPCTANAVALRIYSCAEWSASPPSDALVTLNHPANRILVHHIASANSTDYSLQHAFQICRNDQADHMDNSGWADTGQHFTISRGGYKLEGRHGSLSTLRSSTQMIRAAHCPGQNENAIGIENEGLYASVEPPQAQWNALVVPSSAPTSASSTGFRSRRSRDTATTLGPGDRLYAKLPQLRKEVAAAVAG